MYVYGYGHGYVCMHVYIERWKKLILSFFSVNDVTQTTTWKAKANDDDVVSPRLRLEFIVDVVVLN